MANTKKSTNSTHKKKKTFLELYAKNNCNIALTCQKINIDRKTYYNWIKSDKQFDEECDNLREGLIDYAESMLMNKIMEGNITAIIFFLKTRGKTRGYSEQQNDPENCYNVNVTDMKSLLGEMVVEVKPRDYDTNR